MKPSVPKFSEEQFTEWKNEIESMIESRIYHKDLLKQAVRNAITGRARKVLATLTHTATIRDILDKLESNFGYVKSEESLIEEFYTAVQGREEDVASWGTRLESIFRRAVEKGQIDEDRKESILKTRFWRHLRNTELRNATRIYYETNISFEEFKRKVRREEQELETLKQNETKVNVQQTNDQGNLMKEMFERMSRLEAKINELSKKNSDAEPSRHFESYGGRGRYPTRRNNYRGSGGRGRSFAPSRGRYQNQGDYQQQNNANTHPAGHLNGQLL
ncbi:uncharacterized protein LOC128219668 [Mya arenaria]|uniref:uncharacterized protein LOC128219668 n=1 Tax=Mya arenaria TaxID=6604 RepID=UPI0022E30DA9|nr:uncharacterized protein LOC128219668 [Mya arenaria]